MTRTLRASWSGALLPLLLTLALWNAQAWADEAADDRAAAGAKSEGIEEIIVTSRKREEAIQSVPVAVTAITSTQLQRRFADDLKAVTSLSPNVLLEPVGAFQNASSFFIRGIGTTDIESTTDPSAAFIMDGALQGRISTALVDLHDIENIQILRGPQGTLFGRNSTSGAVVVKSNRPVLNEWEFIAEGRFGNYERRDGRFVVNAPLLEDLAAVRVSALWQTSEGFYKNKTDGRHLNGDSLFSLRPTLYVEPTDDLDITVIGEYVRDRGDSNANPPASNCGVWSSSVNQLICASAPDPAAITFEAIQDQEDDVFDVEHNKTGRAVFDVWGITFEANYETPWGTITAIYNHRDVEEDVDNDFDTAPFDFFDTNRVTDFNQDTAELRFTSTFSDTFDFVTGFFYYDGEYHLQQTTFLGFAGINQFGESLQDQTSYAWFGQGNYRLWEDFRITLGGRYTYEKKEFDHCPVVNVNVSSCSPAQFFPRDDETWQNFSPKAGFDYQVMENAMLYFTWGKGFRSGGYSGRATTPNFLAPFDEEEVSSFEVGVKTDWFGDRVRLNLAAFWNEYDDLQRPVIVTDPTGGGGGQQTIIQNAADARVRGVEMELTILVTEDLLITSNVGYLDSEYDEYCSDIDGAEEFPIGVSPLSDCGMAENVGPGPGGGDLWVVDTDNSGLPLQRNPRWTLQAGVNYVFPFELFGTFNADFNWRYMSHMSNSPFKGSLGARTGDRRIASNVIDASINWLSEDGRYRVSIFGKNLTEELYQQSSTWVATLFNFQQPNNPREYGVELEARSTGIPF